MSHFISICKDSLWSPRYMTYRPADDGPARLLPLSPLLLLVFLPHYTVQFQYDVIFVDRVIIKAAAAPPARSPRARLFVCACANSRALVRRVSRAPVIHRPANPLEQFNKFFYRPANPIISRFFSVSTISHLPNFSLNRVSLSLSVISHGLQAKDVVG